MKQKFRTRNKVFSEESFIQVFMPDLAKLSLLCKIIVSKKLCKFLLELPGLKLQSKKACESSNSMLYLQMA